MMKKKSLGFSVLSVLTLLTLLGFASATITFSNVPTLSPTGTSFSVTVTTNQTETVSFSANTITDSSGKTVTFTPAPGNATVTFTSPSTLTQSITFNYAVPSGFVFQTTGTIVSTTLSASSTTPSDSATQALSFPNQPQEISACKLTGDPSNNLDVSIDSTSVTSGFGSDTTWYPLDDIQAKVRVTNNGNVDQIRNIVVRWALYDTGTKKVIMHDKLGSFNLKEDSDKLVTIDFSLSNPNLFNKNTGPYILYVWADGEDKQFSGNATCASDSDSVDVNKDDNFVVLNSLQVVGTASCGSSVQVTGKIWNIGSNDEDGVYVTVYNTELGISQKLDIGTISAFDSQDVLFNFDVPNNAQDGKIYNLKLDVYDNDNNIFENSNNDKASFTLPFTVTGACTNLPPVSIITSSESNAVAGQDLTIKATITNTASITKTFSLELSDYTNWASLVSIDKSAVTLDAGKSTDVLIKLNVNKGVSGEQTFNIVMKEGTRVLSQPVSVPVQKAGLNLTGLFSKVQGNVYLWGIGALNILLVLIIIVVAARVVRKK